MLQRDIEDLHAAACYRGDVSYIDPETGYNVFTSVGLMKKGTCCGSGCRHCPYGRMNCAPGRAHTDTTAVEYLESNKDDVDRKETAVVFFSGGKDSFLALYLARQIFSHVVLLSTYDPMLRMNGIQRVPIDSIREFSSSYQIDLVTVPVSTNTLPYTDMVQKGLQLLLSSRPTTQIVRLVFGDIHLEHIRQWKLDEFSKRLGYKCWFPLWEKPYDTLTEMLHRACLEYEVTVIFSAIYNDDLRDKLNIEKEKNNQRMPTYQESIDILAQVGVDQFGENGEFHTMVSFSGEK